MLYSDVDLVLLACWDRAFGGEGVAESVWKQQQRYKVVFEDDYDMHQVRGGPGNPPLLRWRHDDAFVYGGVQYLWEPLEYDYAVNSSDIEDLL